ncbi:unnamed protein product [Cyprideis torosa]|uniref:Uncharacterized protein n=1 Tax=Cyprideis torosa TaxID=163714 RepID=A0A7R8ZK54_9CRUS|nr:unnamed protein product [Cyprideis torosa]CAG0881028.1 unnamed protein product [Cyprideis torosa]
MPASPRLGSGTHSKIPRPTRRGSTSSDISGFEVPIQRSQSHSVLPQSSGYRPRPVPLNGTTYSAPWKRYVVHCPPPITDPGEYLTPTQRAHRENRELKLRIRRLEKEISRTSAQLESAASTILPTHCPSCGARILPETPHNTPKHSHTPTVTSAADNASTNTTGSTADSGHFEEGAPSSPEDSFQLMHPPVLGEGNRNGSRSPASPSLSHQEDGFPSLMLESVWEENDSNASEMMPSFNRPVATATAEDTIHQLLSQLREINQEYFAMRRKCIAAEDEARNLALQVADLQAELEKQKEQNRKSEEKVQSLETLLQQEQSRLEQADQEARNLHQRVQEMESVLRAEQDERKRHLAAETRQLVQRVHDVETLLEKEKAERKKTLSQDARQLTQRVRDLENLAEGLQEKGRQMIQRLEAKNDEIKRMKVSERDFLESLRQAISPKAPPSEDVPGVFKPSAPPSPSSSRNTPERSSVSPTPVTTAPTPGTTAPNLHRGFGEGRVVEAKPISKKDTLEATPNELLFGFLKSAVYYLIMDRENQENHLRAILGILGFSAAEKALLLDRWFQGG